MKDKAQSKLRVHVYTMCWNEKVILPHFLRHYSSFDKVVIFDNESTDDSLGYAEEFSNVEIRTFDSQGSYSEETLIDFKNNVWKESRGKADFVIVCDSDEFLYHPKLLLVLEKMLSLDATILLPMAYQMVGNHVPDDNENLLSVIPHGVRLNNYDKCVLFDPNQIEEINYKLGAHVCNPVGNIKYFRVPGLMLLHYKYFTPNYVFSRNQQYTKRAIQAEKDKNFAPHHRLSFQQVKGRYNKLYSEKVDVFAKLGSLIAEGSQFEQPVSLKNDYKLAIKAFKKHDYKTALTHLEMVAEWQPERYRIGAMLSVILRSQKLFLLEPRQVKNRTESIALSVKPKFNVLYDMAKFYHYANHPRYALRYAQRACELKPKHKDLELLMVKINYLMRHMSEIDRT